MIFRMRLLFVIAAMALFSGASIVQAAEVKSELPLAGTYDFKGDPFLLNWTFVVENEASEKVADAPLSFEEKTLNRWREKQAHLWAALPKERFTINASAYTAAADECGKSDGITASGLKVEEKRTLACPPAFPFGTKISIEGVGELRCEDRGGAIKGNHFDIYVETKTEAFAFGRRNLVAEVIE
ncbi:MAG: 3D domain-containing protein [Patescibacteria group bacterium]